MNKQHAFLYLLGEATLLEKGLSEIEAFEESESLWKL